MMIPRQLGGTYGKAAIIYISRQDRQTHLIRTDDGKLKTTRGTHKLAGGNTSSLSNIVRCERVEGEDGGSEWRPSGNRDSR